MDETFDNSIILHKENESIDVGVDQDTSKQAKLEVRALETMQEDASAEVVEEVAQVIVVKNSPKEQPYNIFI